MNTLFKVLIYSWVFSLFIGIQGCSQNDEGFPGFGATPAPASATAGVAPTANNVAITPPAAVLGQTLTGSYTYADADNDPEGTSTFRWLVNNLSILNETSTTLSLTQTLTDINGNAVTTVGATISFCVTPVATVTPTTGTEVCVPTAAAIIAPPPPSATVAIRVGAGAPTDAPLVGQTLTGSYTYVAASDGRPEGSSIIQWRVNGTNTGTSCAVATACPFTVTSAHPGSTLEYCVTPVNNIGIIGTTVCTSVTGASITMVGRLAYDKTLTVTVVGLSGNMEWRVDTDDRTGPAADTNKTVPPGTTNTASYRIGTQNFAGNLDTNGNGAIDDHDWFSGAFVAPALDATHFIGKDVQFCITDLTYGEQCVLASAFQASATSMCTDDTACVVEGIYYDYPNITARGIAPRITIGLSPGAPNNFMTLHRPITLDELQFSNDGTLSFGTNLPSPDATAVVAGLEYPLYNHGDPTAARKPVTFCLNFATSTADDWSLPTATNANSTDAYAGPPNNNTSPSGNGQNIQLHSTGAFRLDPGLTYEISPTFGWPLSIPYWNAYWTALLGIYETNLGDTGAGPVVALAGDLNLVGCFRDSGVSP